MKLLSSFLLLILGITVTAPHWETVEKVSHEEYHSNAKYMWVVTNWILDSDSSYHYVEGQVEYEMLFNSRRDSVFIWNNIDDSYEIRTKPTKR
jgi:hypothetical protein